MNLFAIAGLSCGITSLILGLVAIIYGKIKLHRILAFFNIAVAFWGFGGYLVGIATTNEAAIFGWKFAHIGGMFVSILFFHLVSTLCKKKNTVLLVFGYSQAVIFNILSWFTYSFINHTRLTYNIYYNDTTFLFGLAVFSYVFLVAWSFIELLMAYKTAGAQERTKILYVIFGFMFGFLGGTSTFLPEFRIDSFYPAGNFGIVIYCVIVTYAILRYRLLDMRVAITRTGIFVILYAIVLGVPFYIGYITHSWILSTSFAAILATIGPIAYRVLQSRAENIILAEQRRYQKILIQAAEGMAREHDLKRLLNLIVHVVTRIVRIRFAAVFLYDQENKKYTLRAVRDHMKICIDLEIDEKTPFSEYIKKHRDPFLIEELPNGVGEMLKEKCDANLVVPSFMNEQPLGFLLLGEKLNTKTYSQDDIGVFKLLSQQTSMAIANCIFMEESKRSQERIFAAEKLAAIGGMADGVAHQIRNRLNHFSVVAGDQQFEIEEFKAKYSNLLNQNEDLRKSLDYLLEGAKSITDNVKKSAIMIEGILNFAKVDEKAKLFSEFSLKKVVDTSIEVVKTKHQLADFPLISDYGKNDKIYGVEVQIRECIYNVLDNAYEAIREKIENYLKEEAAIKSFKPEISLKFFQKANSYVIEISDNGIGIKEENKHKIFSPFFTTKPSVKSGTGIGMYVVKRMIEENHHGRAHFESKYGIGTKIFIEVPKSGTKLT
ncbi:MAG: ATP-binding protein [Elusimicrobia bacterium]|nr:ATP-binding protein [Elusimicrobiota bacterium]